MKFLLVIFIFLLSSFSVFAEENSCVSTQGKIEKNIFGLADLSLHEEKTIELLDDLGIEWVRMEIRWDRLELARDSYRWDETDRIIKNLRDKNINIQVVVDHPPVWAHPIETFNQDFAKFMERLILRYKSDGVRHWEIFNEPNLAGHGWPFRYDDREFAVRFYASVLKTANNVIRKHDPDAIILNAGLSPDGIDPFFFLDAMYRIIGKNCFDVLAFHPYGKLDNLSALSSDIKQIMAKYEDQRKYIWFNEYGTGTDSERKKLLTLVASQIDNLDGFIWFTLRDLKPFGWRFGLVEYNWQKKLDYKYFKEIYSSWKKRKKQRTIFISRL